MIKLKDVSKTYRSKKSGKVEALKNITFTLPDKGLVFIVGKSGSGKSTLLNIIGGLDSYDKGEVWIDNTSTKKFKGKDFDYYRNTYIGFVFQEYNLLEEYNVYDNIQLALKLQHQKFPKERLDKLLANVGLEGLGERKISELSGGQKQRASIARAIVKKPDIILADEPTGALDSITSEQIFMLLKRLSAQKLVIVVSHDEASARKYGDRIIALKDGSVTEDSVQVDVECQKEFIAKKSSLPFLSALKFAFLNLKYKKLRLFFTILLTTIAIVFFGMAKTLTEIDVPYAHANAMIRNKQNTISIIKNTNKDYETGKYYMGNNGNFEEEEILKIESELGRETAHSFTLYEDNTPLHWDYTLETKKQKAYYAFYPGIAHFIYDRSVEEKIIGRYPQNNDEIAIHSYLADFFMKLGAPLYTEGNLYKQEYYFPESYEKLLTEGKYLKMGSSKVKVVGIIKDDTQKYESLKKIDFDSLQKTQKYNSIFGYTSDRYGFRDFATYIQAPAQMVYVNGAFMQYFPIQKNRILTGNDKNIYFKVEGKRYSIDGSIEYLSKKIRATDGNGEGYVENIKDGEIIVSTSFLNRLSKGTYKNGLESYLRQHAQEELYTEEELSLEFLKKYIKENQIVGMQIELEAVSFENIKEESERKPFKIIGVSLTEENHFVKEDSLEAFMIPRYKIEGLYFKENQKKELEEIFKKFPLGEKRYTAYTVYADEIYSMNNFLIGIQKLMIYVSAIFGIFAVLLLLNFITVSISYSKKQIGILRAMGARKRDVFKIFVYEGYIIGLFSFILGVLLCMTLTYFGNQYFMESLFAHVSYILFTPRVALTMFLYIFVSIFVSSLFMIRKITKLKPMDAILGK